MRVAGQNAALHNIFLARIAECVLNRQQMNEKPLSTHSAERTLYQVQVRRRLNARPSITLNGKFIDTEWEPMPLLSKAYQLTDHVDTCAELDDGLFPYPLAMHEAWGILSVEHAHAFEVRLVPHLVKTSYATFPQEPMLELDRHPTA